MRIATFLAAIFATVLVQVRGQTLLDLVVETDTLSTLEAAVIQADLVDTLNNTGPYTVFAPTDTAFQAVDSGLLAKLLTDPWKAHLANILLYHVAPGDLEENDLDDEQILTMANEENVTISKSPGEFMVNAANVASDDIAASNGIAHVIDAVLLPSFLGNTIVDIAMSATTTLASLVEAAGLVDTLNTTDGLTVFAPTNDAFAALDNATLSLLTSEEGEATLIRILQYHVVDSVIPSTAINQGETEVPSLLTSANLTIVKNGESVTVDSANVVAADVLAINGIVHVIDSVLMPPEEEEDETTSSATTKGTLGASVFATLSFLLASFAS